MIASHRFLYFDMIDSFVCEFHCSMLFINKNLYMIESVGFYTWVCNLNCYMIILYIKEVSLSSHVDVFVTASTVIPCFSCADQTTMYLCLSPIYLYRHMYLDMPIRQAVETTSSVLSFREHGGRDSTLWFGNLPLWYCPYAY